MLCREPERCDFVGAPIVIKPRQLASPNNAMGSIRMDTQLFGWILLAAFVSAAHDSDEDGIMQLLESLKEVHGKVNPLAPLEPLLTPFAETAASTATQKSVRNVGRATDDDAASKTRRGSVLNEFLANLETELDVRVRVFFPAAAFRTFVLPPCTHHIRHVRLAADSSRRHRRGPHCWCAGCWSCPSRR